jgi:excisionase family DNA binding protein
MRSTHTFAELEVSPATYAEIERLLRDAGYAHAFVDGAIDMHGIGLKRGVEPLAPPRRPGYYTTHEAARILHVTPMTVIRWIEDGKVRAHKTLGGHRRITPADLEVIVRERAPLRRGTSCR